jgi:hypothetical protein
VLEEQRIAPLGLIEEVRAHEPIEDQAAARHHDGRQRDQNHARGHELGPGKHRHAIERHARRAIFEDGHDDRDRHDHPRQLGERDHLRPDVGPLAGAECGTSQRYVAEPAVVGTDVQRKGDPQEQPAEEKHPIAERDQPRKRDRPRADHERHQRNTQTFHHRHGKQKHHRRAVHREQLVVEIGVDEALLGPSELQSHDHRQHPAEREERNRGQDEASADGFVIDRTQPPGPVRCLRPRGIELRSLAIERCQNSWLWIGAHCAPPRYATTASRSSRLRPSAGIRTPGFTCCGSSIHFRRLSGDVGKVPAAMV